MNQEITFDFEAVGLEHNNPEFRNLFVGYQLTEAPRIFQESHFKIQKDDLSIAHNWKYDAKCTLKEDPNAELGKAYDTQIAFKHLREDLPQEAYKLENLARVFYEYPNYKKLVDFNDEEDLYYLPENIPILKLYNKHDVLVTRLLKEISEPALKRKGMWNLFQMNMDFLKELAFAEMRGIRVDLEELSRQEIILREKEEAVGQYFQTLDKIDWNSPLQVGKYFVEQGFSLKKNKRGYCIDKAALKGLAVESRVAESLLEWRKLRKSLDTYTTGFRNRLYDGIYYPDFFFGPVTQRQAERFIQIMPRPGTSPFKKCIISKFEGGYLAGFDWSQLELKLVAEDSGDPYLIERMLRGDDIHAETLAEWPHLSERTKAKNANFRCVYGPNISFKRDRLVLQYGFTTEQASKFVSGFLKKYPGIRESKLKKDWMRDTYGYVTAITGYRRHLPGGFSGSFQGYNAPIQHLGSVFNKIMFIVCSRKLREDGYESHPVADIHDEIVFDIHPKEKDEVIRVIKELYSNFKEYFYNYFQYELKLIYTSEAKLGSNLFDTIKI